MKLLAKTVLRAFWIYVIFLCEMCFGYMADSMTIMLVSGCENVKVPHEHVIFEISGGSVISCGARCLKNSKCNSFDFDSDTGICVGTEFGGVSKDNGCHNYTSHPEIQHFEKFCLNNGYLNTLETCKCVDSWVGERCERIQKSCREGFLDQGYKFGVFWAHPTLASTPFRIKCLNAGGWNLMLRVKYPTVLNFNRSWEEYKNGFGDVNADCWLGLDNIHHLTNDYDSCLLYTSIQLKNGTTLRSRQANFRIGNESTGYRMTFTLSVTNADYTAGDCYDDIKNQPFTTYDQDNDNSATNCAQVHGGGFWFDNCAPCNPTGLATYPADGILSGDPSEWSWTKDMGNIAPFRIRQHVTCVDN